ncbi:hypothetical protein SCHPADRAFT_946835 [Schizopora paradoxa]|uniref:Uncharacterized protein n=1 Tax=Schizopora paradoxa TaxID=27342 RepID=A0A0H2RL35_9AGAM|nr:hypothetical protein SCHPADRAFT_946835 [Schizopora paradoxa]
MRPSLSLLLLAYGLLQYVGHTAAADCQTATVGSPFSTCFNIFTNANLTADQFAQFNPGLDCSLLQIGQKVCISAGTLPSDAPMPFPNGTCAEYTTVSGDSCSAIATKFDITIAQIEQFNNQTFKWTGCSGLQADFTMCVSSGTPPPIPIIAGLECGPQSEGNATCPLNACCSAFGFCGLTDDFCTTSEPNPCISNCFTPTLPSCSSTRSMRKIGYYAGFGDRRSCGTNITPDQVDWTGFTGAHFAFATITQDLQIQLDDADVPLLQTLVAQKANNPGLQVIIAVGGWDFSEMDPTRDLFSFMIASSSSRATFISSVKSFLAQFKLDGIDIDFEYPSAIERDAPPTDTPNLTSFFQELRSGLGSDVVISCDTYWNREHKCVTYIELAFPATPAGYWFLKGFEIDKIASSVTYLNMMSYDYHGPWDTNVTDQAPVTNPHTSILDMHDSALLYIRAARNCVVHFYYDCRRGVNNNSYDNNYHSRLCVSNYAVYNDIGHDSDDYWDHDRPCIDIDHDVPTTVIIPVPSSTTSVVIQGVTITLNSGGTPVNSPVPTFISQPSAVTPTWTANISPPPNATIVTFTAPLTSTNTFSTTVPVPSKSDSPPVTVTGPSGNHSRCSPSTNIWTLLFRAVIGGCLPADVGIRGGITPSPIMPPGWTGPWTDPFLLPTGGPPPDSEPEPTGSDSNTESSTSTSTSSTSTGSCPTRTPSYDFSDDPENADAADLGTDPDKRRRREVEHKARHPHAHHDSGFKATVKINVTWQSLQRRDPRHTLIGDCSLTITSPSEIDIFGRAGAGTTLELMNVGSRPSGPPNFVESNQEHVFEIQYMGAFFNFMGSASGCDWIQGDVIDHTRASGLSPSNLGQALLAAIDNTQNMVWVDKPMNQAKSNVVNDNRDQPSLPPQAEKLFEFIDFDVSLGNMIEYETFLRNFAALGQYFDRTSTTYRNVAANFQTLLSEITPRTVPDNTRSIPTIFRDWLMGVLASYPNGCTSRANNAWNLYRQTINDIAVATNTQIPPCLPLFNSNNFAPSSFNFMNLIPPAPTTPSCNVPGTSGTVGYVNGSTTVKSLPFAITPQRIMGSGNTNFHAVGSGTSITDTHYQALDASQAGSACTNVVSLVDTTPGSGLDANIAFQCNGASGPQESNFNFVVNGQSLGCAGVITGNAGGDLTNIFCAVSQALTLYRHDYMGSVSLTALGLVLEEIHLQRRADLREWQESPFNRFQRVEKGLKFSDDLGDGLSCLSLVHPTWTSISRRTLGRILLFTDVTMQSAKDAIATPIFGWWTREVYLPFSRDYSHYPGFKRQEQLDDCQVQILTSTWKFIEEVLARTPNVLTFCLQTVAQNTFSIYRCVEKLCDVLPKLNRLRTLRLYSEIQVAEVGFSSIVEIPSFFHALENFPNFECLALRGYLPCFQLSRDERIKTEHSEASSMIVYEWVSDSPPDPYVVTRVVGDSSPLTGRIRSLADLLRSICNTPAQVDEDSLMSIAHCTEFVAFKFLSNNQQFTITAAMIGELAIRRAIYTLPPSLVYPKWCGDVEFFQLLGPHDIAERLSPFPSLKVLQIMFASTDGATPDKMRDEIRWFVDSLPPSLELLSVAFSWESSEDEPLLPLEMHDELDELLATIPTLRCPNIKGLQVEMDLVSKLFRKEYPLKRLIDSCHKRNIPLILFPVEDTVYYGQCSHGFEDAFMIENFVN